MTQTFDPNAAAGADSGIFGLPYTAEQAIVHFLPVPWEATTSYGGGTSQGPQAIFEASKQVDLYDLDVLKPYEPGLFMLPASREIAAWNTEAKTRAAKVIEVGGKITGNADLERALARVNELSVKVNESVYADTRRIIASGKIPGIVGGDHSVPFGAIQAAAEKWPGLGVLHFDAHSDTRDAYEGFEWSHASIMHNVLTRIPGVSKLVQVGIRDFCEEELDFCESQPDKRVEIFFDGHLARKKMEGVTWAKLCEQMIQGLPGEVWISFDIDGLDPRFCPHTGTPVPGGMDFQEANYLIGALVRSGRRVVGFDLNEVAPHPDGADEWDANVGARLLYKLTAWTLASQGKAKVRA